MSCFHHRCLVGLQAWAAMCSPGLLDVSPKGPGLGRLLQGQRWLEYPRSPGEQGAEEEASLLPWEPRGVSETPTCAARASWPFGTTVCLSGALRVHPQAREEQSTEGK